MKRPLILLVEDSPTDEKLTTRAFGRCGVPHELAVVRDGAAEDRERSYALGANAYLRKPVDFSEFTRTAETLATFWLVLNEPAPDRRSET